MTSALAPTTATVAASDAVKVPTQQPPMKSSSLSCLDLDNNACFSVAHA